jgi:hypothetical protein
MKKIFVVLAALGALPLAAAASGWSWQEAKVDTQDAYLDLLYGSADAEPESWTPAVRVGPPRGHVFPVEWLVDPSAAENRALVEAVSSQLDFYLTEVGPPDPWSYAQYHCQTTSNLYGDVHWTCP